MVRTINRRMTLRSIAGIRHYLTGGYFVVGVVVTQCLIVVWQQGWAYWQEVRWLPVIFAALAAIAARWEWRQIQTLAVAGLMGTLTVVHLEPLPAPHAETQLTVSVDRDPERKGVHTVIVEGRIISPGEYHGARVQMRAVELPWFEVAGVERGDTVVVRGQFHTVQPGRGDYRAQRLLRHGITWTGRGDFFAVIERGSPGFIQRVRNYLRDLPSQYEHEEDQGAIALLLTMTFGFNDMAPLYVEDVFRRLGIYHLLVVSGAQVAVFYWISYQLLHAIWLACRATTLGAASIGAAVPAALVAMVYAAVCDFDESVVRAAIAVLIAVTARGAKKFWGRNNVGVGTVMLSAALVMSIVRPATFLEVGTQLTFAALAGIAVATRLARYRSSLYRLLSVTICAGLAAGTVGAIYFPPPPLSSLLVTLLLGPVVAVCNPVLVSIAAAATYGPVVGANWLLSHLADLLCWSVLWLDHQVEISPWVSVASGGIVVLWGVATYRGLRVTGNDSSGMVVPLEATKVAN